MTGSDKRPDGKRELTLTDRLSGRRQDNSTWVFLNQQITKKYKCIAT